MTTEEQLAVAVEGLEPRDEYDSVTGECKRVIHVRKVCPRRKTETVRFLWWTWKETYSECPLKHTYAYYD